MFRSFSYVVYFQGFHSLFNNGRHKAIIYEPSISTSLN